MPAGCILATALILVTGLLFMAGDKFIYLSSAVLLFGLVQCFAILLQLIGVRRAVILSLWYPGLCEILAWLVAYRPWLLSRP